MRLQCWRRRKRLEAGVEWVLGNGRRGSWRSGRGWVMQASGRSRYEDLCWASGKSLEAVWLQKVEATHKLGMEAY